MKGCTPTRVREAHKTALTQAMEVPHRVILSVWDQPRVGFAGGMVWRERLSGEAASGDGLTAVTAMCRPMTGAKTSRAGGRPSARCCGRRLERPRARAGTGGEQVQERHGSRRFRPAVAGCSRVSRSSDQALWSALRLMRVLLRASQPSRGGPWNCAADRAIVRPTTSPPKRIGGILRRQHGDLMQAEEPSCERSWPWLGMSR